MTKKRFPVKKLKDGRAMLNLGCGTRTNWEWNNLDFSPYTYLAQHQTLARTLRKFGFLSLKRYERLQGIDPEVIRHDLRKGIPFDGDTFDIVYHSHFLEHIDKHSASLLLKDCYRVLKPGGVLRVVIPDLQLLIESYTGALSALENGNETMLDNHVQAVHNLFDQMVNDQAAGAEEQRPFVRFVERFIRGSAAKTGQLHRWMYDKYTLKALLAEIGFQDVRKNDPFTSQIHGWNQFYLDAEQDGSIYKAGSLYMEGIK